MVGLATRFDGDVFFWRRMMGGAILTTIPPVLMYILAQHWVVSMLTLESVKRYS
jgi:ABC-type glycerol-3-phosphate transport system permease component